MDDFLALGVLLTIVGFIACTHAPSHWQTPLGFALIAFGWVPVGLLVIAILKHPLLLAPSVFVLGVLATLRPRAP